MNRFLVLLCLFFFSAGIYPQQKNDSIELPQKMDQFNVLTTNDLFYRGVITDINQYLQGKVAGVRIVNDGGSVLGENSMLIRGTSVLNSSANPLYVIDGIPLIGYSSNIFSEILNPNDIESITILKDADEIGKYGTFGVNGVVLLTSKQSYSHQLRFHFSTTNAIQTPTKSADVLSADEFRTLINSGSNAEQKKLLGNANTDWQKEIFRNAFVTNNHFNLSGSIARTVPFYASVGQLYQDGTLLTENRKIWDGTLAFNPVFFNNHLKINVLFKLKNEKDRIANTDAIQIAAFMDPTQPVRSADAQYEGYGGYWQPLINGFINNLSPQNPVALLRRNAEHQTNGMYLGSILLDYKLHFFPDLDILYQFSLLGRNSNYNFEYDKAMLSNYSVQNGWYDTKNTSQIKKLGLNYHKIFNKTHDLQLSAYLQYLHQEYSDSLKQFDQQGGRYAYSMEKNEKEISSYFLEFNYNYDKRLLFSVSLRDDGNSRYSSSYRWSVYPSVSVAYDFHQLLKNKDLLNSLIIKAAYSRCSRENTVLSEYPDIYRQSGYNILYNPDFDKESTDCYDLKINTTLFKKLAGEFSFFSRNTKDIGYIAPVNIGTNQINYVFGNAGDIDSKGIDFSLNFSPVLTKDISWSIAFNGEYQKSKLESAPKSFLNYSNNFAFYYGINRISSNGHPLAQYYVYQQVYGSNGLPLEGVYEDVDNNNKVDNEDRVPYHSPTPDWTFGLSTVFSYRKINVSFGLHSNIGNYLCNLNAAIYGNSSNNQVIGYLHNISSDYLKTGFNYANNYNSSYYIQNASFVRMDYINVGYDLGKINGVANITLTATLQNVFTITKYRGTDPENGSGYDYGFYPRPHIFSIGMKMDI